MYWDKAGEENTDQTIEAAMKRARELKIRHIVVASCSGASALKMAGKGFDLTCVTHHVGFAGPGVDEMSEEMRQRLAGMGIKVLTTTHLMAGIDRAARLQFGGVYPAEIVAQTLRMFGQGVKVAVEIACMAKDAGLIPHDAEIVSIGGTAEGVDAAIVVLPAHSNKFFESQIREIICMPRNKAR
ncbi:MAG: hypothetical protein GXY50_05505 [Syntrophomonadaceae bacterium]|nr:hypothetical protein [Syntrophomonadaceae bacterium]